MKIVDKLRSHKFELTSKNKEISKEIILDVVKDELNKIRSMFVNPHIDVIGPQPCIIEKRKNIFRWQISAKSKNRTLLHNSLNRVLENHKIIGNKVRLSIDVDPL